MYEWYYITSTIKYQNSQMSRQKGPHAIRYKTNCSDSVLSYTWSIHSLKAAIAIQFVVVAVHHDMWHDLNYTGKEILMTDLVMLIYGQ